MAVQNIIKNIRGSNKANNVYKGEEGVITVDLDRKTLRVHDGLLTGGYELARFSDIPTKVSQLDNDSNFATLTGEIAFADKASKDSDGNQINTTYAKLDGATFTGTVKAPTPSNKKENSTIVATTAWVNSAETVVHRTGNETIDGTKTFLKTIDGTALKAYWADLAENYESDFEYPYGTLICFGGEKEVTIATDKVNGVVSEKPALLMNKECSAGLPIALAGRVDVLVKGKVKKFDNIVLSDVAGVGVVDNEAPVDLVIGKALADKLDDCVSCVLCVTKFNLM